MADSPNPSATRGAVACDFSPHALAQAKSRLTAQGMTYAQWADEHGFNRRIVYEILSGRRRCRWGQSHQIAVALGLKNPRAFDPAKEGRA